MSKDKLPEIRHRRTDALGNPEDFRSLGIIFQAPPPTTASTQTTQPDTKRMNSSNHLEQPIEQIRLALSTTENNDETEPQLQNNILESPNETTLAPLTTPTAANIDHQHEETILYPEPLNLSVTLLGSC
ncbi:MAG: hypothetical protein KBC27_02890 [Rickettsiales bacterium]|nr:hypothetical protein [Rickettsiales bacterium]